MRVKIVVLLLLAGWIIPKAMPQVVFATPRGTYEAVLCPDGFPSGAECGYLTVPEHHADPTSPMTIQLMVAVFPSLSRHPQPDPVIYLSGGPGDSLLDYVQTTGMILPALALLRQERDILIFDQRGTGFSKPALTCNDEVAASVLGEMGRGTVAADTAILGAMQLCHDRLVTAGVNLTAFNSVESAGDIEALRLALGYTQMTLFGASYGTTLALYTMQYYPDAIRSVILEAPAPTNMSITGTAGTSFARALAAVFAACAADTACHSAFPTLEADFYELIAEYNAHPRTLNIQTPDGATVEFVVDGYVLINGAHLLLYYYQYIGYFPFLVSLLNAGNTVFMKQFIEYWLTDDPLFGGEFYTFRCSGDTPLTTPAQIQTDLQALNPVLQDVYERNTAQTYATCAIWDVPILTADEIPLQVASDIPTLILTGEFDPITPPAWGALLAATLPNSFLFNIPTAGHGTLTPAMPCPLEILADFSNDPTTVPSGSCLSAMQPLQFTLPS